MKELELFTLPNCPACKRLKETLEKEGIEYTNKDTKEFADEWTDIQNITKTYFLPTLKMGDMYFSPNRDFKNDAEAVELINKVNSGEMVEHEMSQLELRETLKTLLFQFEMVNRGMGNMGRAIDNVRSFTRMPQDWQPEPPQRPNAPQTPPMPPVETKNEDVKGE